MTVLLEYFYFYSFNAEKVHYYTLTLLSQIIDEASKAPACMVTMPLINFVSFNKTLAKSGKIGGGSLATRLLPMHGACI